MGKIFRFIEMLFALSAALLFIGTSIAMLRALNASCYFELYSISKFLETWQTLLTGVLALAGAGWTVKGIKDQIDQTMKLESERNAREERAARVVLPLALSELTQYSLDCINLLAPYLRSAGGFSATPHDIATPRIPAAALEPMQCCARFADPSVADQIYKLLIWLQIQHSRMGSLIQRIHEHPLSPIEVVGALLDAAELHTMCGDIFLYARGSAPNLNSTVLTFEDQLANSLFVAGIVSADHSLLTQVMKERVSRKVSTENIA